ncbi:Uncharacterised protein [Legionella wadsworthii]|uniref:Uncharacterized protein n=1 Tax=Legionella wadsworthii TaxID=28088 RepID=A0A378LWU9_9GAMM|nr:hypothetical protein [Legionella wadsworthii]STY31760.1 Uncharacterised protein [Legionella wadsworthii]
MKWTDRLWAATNWTLDTTIHALADTMSTCGTLVSVAGGAAYAISNVLHTQDVSAAYYGGVRTTGNFSLGVNITNLGYSFNDLLPWYYSNQINNKTPSYNLTEYVSSIMLINASAICIGTGAVLKTLGDNIHYWQQNREERREYSQTHQMEIANPSLKEYVYVSAEAVASGLTLAMFSTAVVAAVLNFSNLSLPDFTYPPKGDQKVYGEHYRGAVITQPFNISLDLGVSNFTIPVYFDNLNILLNKTANGTANATYGGGFFFKSNGATPKPSFEVTETFTSMTGFSAYIAKNFFNKKKNRLHIERIKEAEELSYTLVDLDLKN